MHHPSTVGYITNRSKVRGHATSQLYFTRRNQVKKNKTFNIAGVVDNEIAIGAGTVVTSLIFSSVKSDTLSSTARHRCDVSSEPCCPGVKPRRWTQPLITHFGVAPQV